MFDYSQASILVTGASRGLGLGLVQQLAAKRAGRVIAACRSDHGVAEVQALQLPRVEAMLLDVCNPEHITRCAQSVSSLDLLINNAGTASACGFLSEQALSIGRNEMDAHYFAPLQLTQALLPTLQKSAQAGIINIASIAAISNFKAMGTYSASKAALHFLTQGLRAELKGANIFVQGVYPGPFDTRLAAGYDGPKKSPQAIAALVLEAFQANVAEVFPDDFSRTMHDMFLASPKKLDEAFSQ